MSPSTPSYSNRLFGNLHVGIGVLILFALIKLVIHLYSNGNYGFHRDELLHLVCSHHLAWGYYEFPPFIAFAGFLERMLFGDSVLAARVFPALVGVALIIISGLMAKEMKGGPLAIVLAGACALGAHAYFRNHTLFQPVAFDQFFWTLSYFWLLKYINSEDKRFLLFLGATVGLGLLNKYTMFHWGAGIFFALLLSRHRRVFLNPWLWGSIALALTIFLPNIIWQFQHCLPFFEHIGGLYERHFEGSRWSFIQSQFWAMNPFNFIVWFGGLLGFIFLPFLHSYRVFGFAYLFTLGLFLITNGKAYYLFAIYPILFAGGAVALEQIFKGQWKWLLIILLVAILGRGFIGVPYGTPFLPIEEFAKFAGLSKDQEGRLEGLSGDFADMFGWEEQVSLVDSVFNELSASEKRNCIIWAENYGEAGAVYLLGQKYNLPKPISKHGSFWGWGPGDRPGDVVISLGNELDAVSYFFGDYQLVKMIKHPYAIDEEHNIPLYLCRKPKIRLRDYWPEWRDNIFD